MVSRWRMGVVVSGAMLLSACGGGGGGAEVNGDVLTGKQTTYSLGGVVTGLSTGTLTLANAADGRALDTLQIVGTGATELSFTFAKELPTQTGYAISVVTSPSGLGCSVVNGSSRTNTAAVTNIQINCEPNAYNVSGTVTGLVGSGLQLKNNATDTLNVAASTPVGTVPFNFPTALNGAASYAVTVATQPVNPTQNCVVTNGSGAGTGSNINTVAVSCTTQSFTVGGSIAGLTGTGLQLQNNGGSTLTLTPGATSFAFPAILSGTTYNVTVVGPTTNPIQNCVVSPATASGTVGGSAITSVVVNCNTNTYTVGGTVTGLGSNNSGLQLQLSKNGSVVETKPIAGDGGFAFSQTLTDGNTYSVAISTFHSHYVCTLTNASGPISGSNVSNVGVSCVAPIVVTVSGLGASNAGLVLSNSYGTSSANTTRAVETLTIAGDGAFQFSTRLPSARAYTITVSTPHPDYQCTISNGDSFVGAAPININVACTARTYRLSGSVTGLTQSDNGLVLNNNGERITINPTGSGLYPFEFSTRLLKNASYNVTVETDPNALACTVANGSGIINQSDVVNIAVACVVAPNMTATASPASGSNTSLLVVAPEFTFSQPINSATVNLSRVTLTSAADSSLTSAVETSNNVIRILPTDNLLPLTTYTATINTEVRSINKHRLATPVATTFSTGTGWQSPIDLGAGGGYGDILGSYDARVIVKSFSNGDAFAFWNLNTYIPPPVGCDIVCIGSSTTGWRVRRYIAATQTWSDPVELVSGLAPTPYAVGLSIGVDAQGNAIALWSDRGSILERRYSVTSGTWGATRTVVASGVLIGNINFALDSTGSGWLVSVETQSEGGESNVYRRRYAGNDANWESGTWSSAELLETEIGQVSGAQISLDNQGNAVATWLRSSGSTRYLEASYIAAGGSWGAAATLAVGGVEISQNKPTLDANGNAMVVWPQSVAPDINLFAKRFVQGTGWETNALLIENLGGTAYVPSVISTTNGNTVVAWVQIESNTSNVYVNRFNGSTWSGPLQIESAPAIVNYITVPAVQWSLQLAADSHNNVSLVWMRLEDSVFYLRVSRFTNRVAAWSPASRLENLSAAQSNAYLSGVPGIVFDSSGQGIVVWGKGNKAYASLFAW